MAAKATEFKLSGIERVKKVHLTSTQFLPQNDLATPTMKLKRFNIAKHFAKELQDLYLN